MNAIMLMLEKKLQFGGIKKDIILLLIGGSAVVASLLEAHFHFCLFPCDTSWFAVILCGLRSCWRLSSG